ncbi:MAG: CBU_0592 family membrane protein [Terriglobales bacterium]
MHISFARQVTSFIGALLVLVGYIGHQLKWMDSRRFSYNALNAIGSGILAYIAFSPFQVGFVVMEVTWVAVSLYALGRSWKTE